jgi:photosystem II stability/assembly factor-like uncharacterized protein
MNYTWQIPFDWADTWRLDYSTTALPALNENSLSEQTGLGTPAGYSTVINVPFSGPGRKKKYASSRPGTPADWDADGTTSTTLVAIDVNIFPTDQVASPGEILTSQADWPVLLYNFRRTPKFITNGLAKPTEEIPEMMYQDFLDLDSLPPPKPRHFIMDGQIDPEAVRLTSGNGIALYAAYRDGELYVATNSAQSQNADMFVFVTADNENPGIPASWLKSGQVATWDAFLGNESSDNSAGWYDANGALKRNNAMGVAGANILEGVIDLGLSVGFEPYRTVLAVGKYQTSDGGPLLAQAPPGDDDGDIEADGELYSYVPGIARNWYQTAGPSSANVFSLLAVGSDEIYAGTGTGIFKTTNGGDSWTHLTVGLPVAQVSDFERTSNGNVYSATDVGVFLSTNGGATWQVRSNGLADSNAFAVIASPQGSIFAGTRTGGFRSTDEGANWTLMGGGLPSDVIRAFAIDSSGYILAGSSSQGLFRSTDDGISWSPTGMSAPNVWSIMVDRLGRIYYVKSSPSIVYRSLDGGLSWTNILFTSMHSQEIGVDKGGRIYSATAEGVLLSSNDGATWDDITEGIPGQSTRSLVITSNDNVYVGTSIAGVCRRLSSATTSIGDVPTELPSRTSIYQNYPNPFNPSTTIRYELPRSSRVSIKVYNTLGQEVATLVNETKPAGVYTVEFDAAGLASGMYFYRLQAGDFVQTKKLVVLK